MAYDEGLAERVRQALPGGRPVDEKAMFGGLCFLSEGRMFVGIVGEELMVRVGPARYAEALAAPHARPMDFTGRPMKGYVFVGPAGCGTDETLRGWVSRALEFVSTLPPAKKAVKRRPARG
jgi:TfoX/Sxy family transcriptional regulator of competence genes